MQDATADNTGLRRAGVRETLSPAHTYSLRAQRTGVRVRLTDVFEVSPKPPAHLPLLVPVRLLSDFRMKDRDHTVVLVPVAQVLRHPIAERRAMIIYSFSFCKARHRKLLVSVSWAIRGFAVDFYFVRSDGWTSHHSQRPQRGG